MRKDACSCLVPMESREKWEKWVDEVNQLLLVFNSITLQLPSIYNFREIEYFSFPSNTLPVTCKCSDMIDRDDDLQAFRKSL